MANLSWNHNNMFDSRRWRHVLVPFILILLLVCCQRVEAKKRRNERFDPDANDTTVPCTIPPYQDTNDYFRPQQGQCQDSVPLSLETISKAALQALAVQYAPVIFFHPLEKYTLSSVNATFGDPKGGKIFDKSQGNEVIDHQLNLTTLLRTSRDPVWGLNSKNFFFEVPEWREAYKSPPEARFGDGYYEDGRSKATIYFNTYDSGNGTWTFNYFLYYTYNGEGNLGIVSTYQGKNQYTRFQLKPYGVHEGDWEAVSVMACPPATNSDVFIDNVPQPLAVTYQQHGWSQITDCTKGECNFYKNTNHPVGFSALNSHATYPISAEEIIYTKVPVGFFFNLQAFLVVDRTSYKKQDGSYNYFFPQADNLMQMQHPADLTLQATELEPYFWQGFGGYWGNSLKEKRNPEPPLCLADDQLSFVECPDQDQDPVFDLVMQLMGVAKATDSTLELVQSVSNNVVEIFSQTGAAPNGPVTKNFYQRWLKPKTNPFWSDQKNMSLTAVDYCNAIIDIPNITYSKPIDKKDVDGMSAVLAQLIWVAVLTCLNFVIPLVVKYSQNKRHHVPIRFEDDGIPTHPFQKFWCGHWHYSVGAIVYTLFFIVMLISGIVFIQSSEGLVDNLERLVPGINWNMAFAAIQILAIIVIVINFLLFIFLWLQVFEMRNMINNTYSRLLRVEKVELSTKKPHGLVPWSPEVVDILFRFCFAILFLSMMLAMVCVLIGIATVGFAMAFVTLCNTVVGAVDGYCLDLNSVGIEQVLCGNDFQELCNEWAREDVLRILWASFFVFVAHFYVIAATGFAAHQRQSIPAILELYPSCTESSPVSGRIPKDMDGIPESAVKVGDDEAMAEVGSPTMSQTAHQQPATNNGRL